MPKPRTPTAIKILGGETRPCRINRNEPKGDPGAPPCPDHLDERGRREWDRLVPVLTRMEVLTVPDADALAL